MKLIPNSVSAKVGRQILLTQKHSPTILFAGGVVGVVAATVLACRATLKLDEVLQETQNGLEIANTLERKYYSETDRKKDIAYIYVRSAVGVVKLYGPAVVVGSLSIAALTGSHNILSKRNAALTAAYAALEKGFADYRRRVVAELGEDKDREFRYSKEERDIVTETDKGPKVDTEIRCAADGASIYARFFDQLLPSWSPTPEYNRFFLQCQQNYMNDMLRARGHVFLNEVYDCLGLERTKAGSVVGWVISKEGDNVVDFGIFNGNDPLIRDFVNGREGAILLDFNVDGVIYDKI